MSTLCHFQIDLKYIYIFLGECFIFVNSGCFHIRHDCFLQWLSTTPSPFSRWSAFTWVKVLSAQSHCTQSSTVGGPESCVQKVPLHTERRIKHPRTLDSTNMRAMISDFWDKNDRLAGFLTLISSVYHRGWRGDTVAYFLVWARLLPHLLWTVHENTFSKRAWAGCPEHGTVVFTLIK